jgi:NPCBM/NEW2 domain
LELPAADGARAKNPSLDTRIQSLAWRFDVAIPEGAKMISLVAMDAGDGSREDFADWANAGFVLKR